MKTNFSKSSGRLRGRSWAFLLGLVLSVFAAAAQPLPLYSNSGTISGTPPQVDAINFNNSGIWNIDTDPTGLTPLPYQTSDTLTYTNTGTMTGSDGWEFDFGSSTIAHSFYGGPYLSAIFFNGSRGTIEADDGYTLNPPNSLNLSLVSYLLIGATNIVNKGTLIAGANGEIVLNGANVTLSRSILEITAIQGQGSPNGTTNYLPDVQVYGLFWGTNAMGFSSPYLWDGTNVFTSDPLSFPGGPLSFLAQGNMFNYSSSYGSSTLNSDNNTCGAVNIPVQIVSFVPAVGSDSTNIIAAVTNLVTTDINGDPFTFPNVPEKIIKQAVFLNIQNPGITGQVRFSPSPSPTNFAKTVAVRLTMISTNVITLAPQTSSVYLVDTLVSETNQGLIPSVLRFDPFYTCSGPVDRPANYIVQRTDAGNFFANGSPGDGLPATNFFYDPSFTNFFVQANYTDYAAYIDNLVSDLQSGTTVTNLAGRIIINANNLDLTRADLVAGGSINIQASNLVGSAGAVMSCQNLSYNFGSTNGNLNFTNLAGQSVSQLQGNIAAWSAVWTNYMVEVFPNYTYDTNNTPPYTPAFITNITEIDFYVLVVDASSLSDQVPVTVQNLILHSTNIVVSDSVTVAKSFLLDGTTFTLLGQLTLSGSVPDWTGANAPNLLYFTNNGELFIPNGADFGDDTAVPYKEFVNQGVSTNEPGIIVSGDQTIDSLDLQINKGINYTFTGDFSATAGKIVITGPPIYSYFSYFGNLFYLSTNAINSANNINLYATNLLINSAALSASGALNFNVTTNLSDNGTASSFTCYSGFNLWIKPQTGDLLGSTITSIASLDSEEIDHAWAGNDLGQSLAGFTNNVAIGTLVLSAQNPHPNNFWLEPLFHFYGTGGASGNAMYVNNLDLSQLTDFTNEIYIDPSLTIYYASAKLNSNVNITGYTNAEAYLNNNSSLFGPRLIWVLGQQNTSNTNSSRLYGTGYNGNIGTFHLSISNNQLGQMNIIQASTNLLSTNWMNIYTGATPILNFTDMLASNYPTRFYRTKLAP